MYDDSTVFPGDEAAGTAPSDTEGEAEAPPAEEGAEGPEKADGEGEKSAEEEEAEEEEREKALARKRHEDKMRAAEERENAKARVKADKPKRSSANATNKSGLDPKTVQALLLTIAVIGVGMAGIVLYKVALSALPASWTAAKKKPTIKDSPAFSFLPDFVNDALKPGTDKSAEKKPGGAKTAPAGPANAPPPPPSP
jgi:hypothetical protein